MKIIIEGGKFTGKSTFVKMLSKHFRKASVFEFRGYLIDSSKHRYTVHNSMNQIILKFIDFLSVIGHNEQIHLRGHLFPIVISEITNQKIHYDFQSIDEKLLKLDYRLILLTTEKEEYIDRANQRSFSGLDVNKWDTKWVNAIEIQNQYRKYYELSKLNKMKISTSEFNKEDCFVQIKNWLENSDGF